MLKLLAELKNYNRRVDNSVSLRFDTLYEMKSQDIAEIDSHRGDIAMLVLSDTPIGNDTPNFDIDEIIENMPENDAIANYKSPSKRFRDILWVVLKSDLDREPSKEEFADFYKRIYDKLCIHYKEKIKEPL
jgi:hypothetical protein